MKYENLSDSLYHSWDLAGSLSSYSSNCSLLHFNFYFKVKSVMIQIDF